VAELPLDLTGAIATAIDGADVSGHPLALGYVDDAGHAALSYRGSVYVYSPWQLALWSRSADGGLVAAIARRPQVSLLYYARETPGPRYLSIGGRARVVRSVDERVYATMPQHERERDPDAAGVAVIVDVDRVLGFDETGRFTMARA